jgi:uncharacterized protein YdhG (YjbR/CyaY superfamily)
MNTNITTIKSYIAQFPKSTQEKLNEVYKIIKDLVPEATETIKYGMPTFMKNGNLIHFAGYSKHIGIYPMPATILKFENELKNYKTSKGAMQFSLDKPIPKTLLKNIVKIRIKDSKRDGNSK